MKILNVTSSAVFPEGIEEIGWAVVGGLWGAIRRIASSTLHVFATLSSGLASYPATTKWLHSAGLLLKCVETPAIVLFRGFPRQVTGEMLPQCVANIGAV